MADDLPFALETAVERRIAADPEWREGIEWGRPRRGHAEGAVKHHVADVLANVEREATSPDERRRLRLAALVHDTFKHSAAEGSARVGTDGHHGSHAARFLERFVDDDELVTVVRWHDEAFAAWLSLSKRAIVAGPNGALGSSSRVSGRRCLCISASSAPTTRRKARARSR